MGNLSLFKSILYAFFIFVTLPAVANEMCSPLFLSKNIHAKKSLLEQYGVQIQEFRQQSSSAMLTVSGRIKESLEWMKLELEDAELKTVQSKDPVVTKEISKLKSDIQKLSQQKKISYRDYIALSYRFSGGMSFKFSDKLENKSEVLEILNGKRSHEVLEKINESPFFFLPTKMTLGIESMNLLHAEGIAVLGLSSKIQMVDGRSYLPHNFFRHDIDHTMAYERQPFTLSPMTVGASLKDTSLTYPTLDLKERSLYYQKFKKHVDESTKDLRQKQIYHVLWFVVFHETGLPIHPQNLSMQLKLLMGESESSSRIDTLLKRLNNQKDLGYSFKDQKLTEEEIYKASQDLIEFTQK